MRFFQSSDHKRLTFAEVGHKLNAQNERRIRLDFQMLLTAENLMGAPEQIQEAFNVCAKGSASKVNIPLEIENQTFELYELPDSVNPMHQLISSVITAVVVKLEEAEGSNLVYLTFSTTVPYTDELWAWAGRYKGAECFALFFETQGTIAEEPKASNHAIDFPDSAADVASIPTKGKKRGKDAAAADVN